MRPVSMRPRALLAAPLHPGSMRPDPTGPGTQHAASARIASPRRSALAWLAVAGLALGACAPTVQTSSGAEWAARAPAWAEQARALPAEPAAKARSTDRLVLEAASTEPLLRLPARIGLARIEGGRLAAIPADEAEPWSQLAAELGPTFGTFVPVSPLIAEMARASLPADVVRGVVEQIRIGAARQHVDAVLLYEAIQRGTDRTTPFSVLDLTVIGAFLLPTRVVEGSATAQAVLIDVRNGYPYGTAASKGTARGSSPTIGSSDAREVSAGEARVAAVGTLAGEVRTMAARLAASLAARPDQVAAR